MLRILFLHFLTSSLDSKIGLRESNLFLSRVSILCDQVSCVACQSYVADLTLCVGTNFDHFVDVDEMVFHMLTRISASLNSFCDDRQEVSIIGVAKKLLKFPCRPIFDTAIIYL